MVPGPSGILQDGGMWTSLGGHGQRYGVSGHGIASAAYLCLDHSPALACFLELPCHFLFTPSSGMKDRYVDLFMSRPSRRNQTMRSFCWWSLFRVGLSFSFPLLGVVFSSLCLALRVFASALFWQPEPVHGPNAIFAHFCDKYKREESVKSVSRMNVEAKFAQSMNCIKELNYHQKTLKHHLISDFCGGRFHLFEASGRHAQDVVNYIANASWSTRN